ncbi:MAG: beta-ketoacyl-[acyl-carrier-protein] synthase family protein [Pirellulaceae bacterium]
MQKPRVWITGTGVATSLGFDFPTFSRNLLDGRSAAQVMVDQNVNGEFRSPGCPLSTIPVPKGWTEEDFRQLPRVEQAALWCCSESLVNSGWADAVDQVRVGIVLGVGGEWFHHWEMDTTRGGDVLYTASEQQSLISLTQKRLGLRGPVTTIAAACASGNHSLALARSWIQQGIVDVCIAGGLEIVTPVCRAMFHNLRALSRRIDDVAQASRPFDRGRDGFVMGEGAVAFVLEAEHVARRRGAEPLAEVAGFGASSDAHHMIIPSSDPEPASKAIRGALADAGVGPENVSYINAHAPGTPVGDTCEARALQLVFGSHCATTPVSSTKSITGHLLSAAASIEALAGITAIRHGAIPPTLNLHDPEHELCHVPHHSIDADVRVVVSNSFGFGGSNTSLVLRKVA